MCGEIASRADYTVVPLIFYHHSAERRAHVWHFLGLAWVCVCVWASSVVARCCRLHVDRLSRLQFGRLSFRPPVPSVSHAVGLLVSVTKFITRCPRIIMHPPRGRGHLTTMLSGVCLSVAYIRPKSWKKWPRKTKIGTEVAHVTRNSDTTFKVKRSKGQRSRSQGTGHIVAASRTACYGSFSVCVHSAFYTWASRILITQLYSTTI